MKKTTESFNIGSKGFHEDEENGKNEVGQVRGARRAALETEQSLQV